MNTDKLKDHIEQDYSKWMSSTPYKQNEHLGVRFDEGKRYIKVVTKPAKDSKGGSCWGFIEKATGDIFKAASWAAPAKHARGNINDMSTWKDFRWTGPQYLI